MRQLNWILIAFLFSLTSQANQPLTLELKCEKIQTNLDSIRQWTTSRGVSCELADQPQASKTPEYCVTDISRCLPPEVLSYQGKNPAVNGPNCWNLAMVMAGVLPALRYSTPEEMAFFMNSPLCRTLGPQEPRRPGDIGALRANGNEVHGFMWVSDDLVFSKNGSSRRSPYLLQSRSGMEQGYRNLQKAECKSNPNNPCELSLDTVRCRSLEEYIRDPETKTPKEIQEAFIRLEHADKCLSGYNFKPEAYTVTMKRNLSHNIEVLGALFDSPEFQKSLRSLPKEQEQFYEQSFLARINSMYHQMGITKQNPYCLTCQVISKDLRGAASSLVQGK